jgi:hypothetical protein
MALAYLNSFDVMGLKRCLEELKALEGELSSLGPYRRMLWGGYRRLQGRTSEAIAHAVAMMREIPPRSQIGWARLRSVTAEMLNETGQHERARDICLEALSHCRPDDRMFPALYLSLDLELVVAEAGLGESEAAMARLDDLFAIYRDFDNPLTHALLHRSRALVGLLMNDGPATRHHLTAMEQLFRSTGNSALVAHGTRLIDRIRQGARALPRVQFAAARGPTSDPAAVAASDRRRSTEAAVSVEELVQVVAETVHANWAVLYASASGSPQQVAATDGAMTKPALDSRVSALIAACTDEEGETSMVALDEDAPMQTTTPYR